MKLAYLLSLLASQDTYAHAWDLWTLFYDQAFSLRLIFRLYLIFLSNKDW